MSSTCIIIANHHTAELTIDSLHSLSTQVTDLGDGRVMAVDNDPGDGSVEKPTAAIEREGWSSWADVMPLDRNGGFDFGDNAGSRSALASACRRHSAFLLPMHYTPRQSHSGRGDD